MSWLLPVLLAASTGPATVESSGLVVVPGHCVGSVCLGDAMGDVRRREGLPRRKLHREGLDVDVWASRSCRNFLFVVYRRSRVVEVHASPGILQGTGTLSAGSTVAEVAQRFPSARRDEYALFDSGKNRIDIEAMAEGITFSFAGDEAGPLVRFVIHKPGAVKSIGYSEGDDWYWFPQCRAEKQDASL